MQVNGNTGQVAGSAAQVEGDAAQVDGNAGQVAGGATQVEGDAAQENIKNEKEWSMAQDWLPRRREEQLSMARKWFEFFTNGNFPKWGITAPEAAGLGFIVHNIETAVVS